MTKRNVAYCYFLLYLLAIVMLFGCIASFGWTRTWAVLIPTYLSPSFTDMRVIQGAVTSANQGLNPQISNPNDPWNRPLNYPLIWVKIGQGLNLPDKSRFIQFCSLEIMCFLLICAYILFRFPSLGLLACLLSGATLACIERGNIDLIIYSLVFVFALVSPRMLSPIPVLVATALKLYPVFLLGILLIKRQFILFITSLIFSLAIFGYMWDELAIIRTSTPSSRWYSYGFPSLALHFSALNLPSWMIAGVIVLICSAISIIALYFRRIEGHLQADGFKFSLFLAGASIYIGTFIFSSNWDNRLIFLILCVPFVDTMRFPLGGFFVVIIIVAMNELIIRPRFGVPGVAIVVVAKTFVFAVLSAYVGALVPTIFERPLKR